ncbi:carbonate dehydratase [Archaeoglobales archaeon]|nr:MAG: carbonate dehydratase [Archaeoglobales archaeon]
MPRKNPEVSWLESSSPTIDETAFIDPRAEVIGDVRIGKFVYVAPFAVLRADEGSPIVIGERTNVQDGVIIHALKNTQVKIGREVSLAHGCVVHGGVEIGDNSFVGFRAIILKSKIGKGSFIGHGAIVIDAEIPDGKFVPHGHIVKENDTFEDVTKEQKEFMEEVVEVNTELAKAYKKLD